jgi:hypothetical protein
VGGYPGRSRSEDDSRQDGNTQSKKQHRPGWHRADRNIIVGPSNLEGQIQDQPCSGIRHGDSQSTADDRQQHAFDQGLAHQPDSRSPQRDPHGDLRPVFESARQHKVCEVATGHQQHTSRGDQQELEPILVFVPHGRYARSARDEVHRLLLPELLFAWLHIRYVAGQPVVELHAQFSFERLRMDAGTDSAK